MSAEALEAKRQQAEDYFALHPDSQEILVVGTSSSFPGLFDRAHGSEGKENEGVDRQFLSPHLTFFSGHAALVKRGSKLQIGSETFEVREMKIDRDGSFQGQLWLV